MNVIERIKQRASVAGNFRSIKVIDISFSEIAELESLQARLAELEEIVRPRPMDEAPEHGGEILIRSGDDHCVATWGKYLDKWGESHGPCWVDASDSTPIKCPDCWWPLPLVKFGG